MAVARFTYNPREKTQAVIAHVNAYLAQYHGEVTLRQLFYRLVALQVLPNKRSAYNGLSRVLVNARRAGLVDDTRIVDHVRAPLRVPTWSDLEDYLGAVRRSYRREKWASQPYNVEVWCEKDAVAGVLQGIADGYEALTFPCRGYDSYPALKEAGERIASVGKPTVILYFGDFDPSGQDMVRDLRTRLREWFGAVFELRLIALTPEQVDAYNLPPSFTKRRDTRRAKFVARHGDRCVELDALDPPVLEQLARENLEGLFDREAFEAEQADEAEDLRWLVPFVNAGLAELQRGA